MTRHKVNAKQKPAALFKNTTSTPGGTHNLTCLTQLTAFNTRVNVFNNLTVNDLRDARWNGFQDPIKEESTWTDR